MCWTVCSRPSWTQRAPDTAWHGIVLWLFCRIYSAKSLAHLHRRARLTRHSGSRPGIALDTRNLASDLNSLKKLLYDKQFLAPPSAPLAPSRKLKILANNKTAGEIADGTVRRRNDPKFITISFLFIRRRSVLFFPFPLAPILIWLKGFSGLQRTRQKSLLKFDVIFLLRGGEESVAQASTQTHKHGWAATAANKRQRMEFRRALQRNFFHFLRRSLALCRSLTELESRRERTRNDIVDQTNEGEKFSFICIISCFSLYLQLLTPSAHPRRDSADSQDTQLLLLLIHFHGLSACLFPAHILARIVFLPPPPTRIALLLFFSCILAVFIVLSE